MSANYVTEIEIPDDILNALMRKLEAELLREPRYSINQEAELVANTTLNGAYGKIQWRDGKPKTIPKYSLLDQESCDIASLSGVEAPSDFPSSLLLKRIASAPPPAPIDMALMARAQSIGKSPNEIIKRIARELKNSTWNAAKALNLSRSICQEIKRRAAHNEEKKIARQSDLEKARERGRQSQAKFRAKAKAEKEKLPPPRFVALDCEGSDFGEPIETASGIIQPHGLTLIGASDSDGTSSFFHKNGERIPPVEQLNYLTSLPAQYPNSIFVIFSGGYDCTQFFADCNYCQRLGIQRGLTYQEVEPGKYKPAFEQDIVEFPAEDWLSKFVKPRASAVAIKQDKFTRILGNPWQHWTIYKGFAVRYVMGKYCEIVRLRDPERLWKESKTRDGCTYKYLDIEENSRIRIYDVFSLFQMSFLQTIKSFPDIVSPQELAIIEKGKASRSDFAAWNIAEIQEYTKAELITLARVMTKVRDTLANVQIPGAEKKGIIPKKWYGPGPMVEACFKALGIQSHFWPMKTDNISREQFWGHCAYYAGIIQLLKQGTALQTIFAYDITSAYPFILSRLPSMKDGYWLPHNKVSEKRLQTMSMLSMVHVSWKGNHNFPLFPLPLRCHNGEILFPPQGEGIYMVDEVRAALEFAKANPNADLEIQLWDALEFIPARERGKINYPFKYIEELFELRAKEPKGSALNMLYKLFYNSSYGKLSQSVGDFTGKPPNTACIWYAAAITAGTRAQLMRAVMHNVKDIIMLSTDGIVSLKPLDHLNVPEKKTLGAWEAATYEGAWFVQSGIYMLFGKDGKGGISRTRGVNPDYVYPSEQYPELTTREEKIAKWFKDYVIRNWGDGVEQASYPYKAYITIGASLGNKDFQDHPGAWVTGEKELKLHSAGTKRVSHGKMLDRTKYLVGTIPRENSLFEFSKPLIPDWVHPRYGQSGILTEEWEQEITTDEMEEVTEIFEAE